MSRRWGWIALGVLAVVVLLAMAVHEGMGRIDQMPVRIVVDGQTVLDGSWLNLAEPWQRGALAVGLALAALAAIVIVPLAIVVVLGVVAGAVALGIALPLLVALAVIALVLSPLVLLVLGIVWLVRRGRGPGASIAA